MERSIVVIAHNIRSLWNIGAVFRSADAFRIHHIYLTGYTAAPPRREISKTALGAEHSVPWSKETDPALIIARKRSEGYVIAALELCEGSIPLMAYRPRGNVCLILGHEIAGVPEELICRSDCAVHIPMLGQKRSLNVSVAAGIAFYQLRSCC